MSAGKRFWTSVLAYARDGRGAAAVEFAVVLPLLTLPLLNVVDLGVYAYQRMQLENAALTGADQVRVLCNTAPSKPPATGTDCGVTTTQVTNFIHNTSLGSSVSLAATSPVVEAYYCILTNGALQQVGTPGSPGSPPSLAGSTCSAYSAPQGQQWSNPTAAPGDYILVSVTYPFTPVFSSVSIVGLLASSITATGWSRVG